MRIKFKIPKSCFILSLFFLFQGYSQERTNIKYYPATDFTLTGKIMDTPLPFHRMDTTTYANLPVTVKNRMTHSSGIAISFKTDSNSIHSKWCNPDSDLSNMNSVMTSVAFRGLDLYAKENGQWQFVGVALPERGNSCSVAKIVENLNGNLREYLLYLPIYSETLSLEIGVDEESVIIKGRNPFKKRILVYGSSIVQGASASRPGMTYPARLSRSTGLNFLNLGMSGVARMEEEVANMIADIEADAFILDCIPNSSPQQVKERTANLIETIRAKHKKAPIILLQSVIREKGYFDESLGAHVRKQNESAYEEFVKIKESGFDNIHFIFADDFLGFDHEGTVDGTHPNDLGFTRMIESISPQILSIVD